MRGFFCLNLVLLSCGSFLSADDSPAQGPTRTILVYEVDWRNVAEKDRPDVVKTLIESLKRRIDPDGAYNVLVRPKDKDRVEIILPTGKREQGMSPADVRRIKQRIAKAGNLEFRILANQHDDKCAIEEARRLFNQDGIAKELEESQRQGLSPPGPRGNDKQPKKYEISLAKGTRSLVTYGWVEITPQELRTLDLDSAAKDDPKRKTNWRKLAKNRNKAMTLSYSGFNDSGEPVEHDYRFWQGALFFSRECQDRNLSPEERKAKAVEYFVLARAAEIDPKTGKRLPAVNGSYLAQVTSELVRLPPPVVVGRETYPAINFTLNEAGAKLFRDLTGKNVPSDKKGRIVKIEVKDGVADVPEGTIKRHLAIILDGQVMSAPTLNSEIAGGKGQITGNFTKKELDALVKVLRAGALPASLRPQPVSEFTVSAKEKKE